MERQLSCAGGRSLDLRFPHVMGVMNVTPDSFSDGGLLYSDGKLDLAVVLQRASQMLEDGASIIDIGGESTRPGAEPVSLTEELDRVIPVIEAISAELPVIVSVDTSKAVVMTEAARAGAGLINDVRALCEEGALKAARQTALPVCLMHMQGQPGTMQQNPEYCDVVQEVCGFLAQRIERCLSAGFDRDQLIVDPGFGFGKTLEHNLLLMNRLAALQEFELPILVAVSRKSMIAKVLDNAVGERLAASVALAALAVDRGASIIRAHDVRATADAIKMVYSVKTEGR